MPVPDDSPRVRITHRSIDGPLTGADILNLRAYLDETQTFFAHRFGRSRSTMGRAETEDRIDDSLRLAVRTFWVLLHTELQRSALQGRQHQPPPPLPVTAN